MVCLQRPCPRAFASARQVARCARAQRAASVVVQARTQVVDDLDDEDDVDKAVAEFLRAQDASERGIEERQQLDKVVGSSEVDDETAKALCRDVTRILRLLKSNRDMDENEAKLIIQVEDPRNEDARKMGVEVASGVSRDELALALDDVCEGRIPKDRIALRVLKTEMSRWPFLEQDAAASDLAPKGAKGLSTPPPSQWGTHFLYRICRQQSSVRLWATLSSACSRQLCANIVC